MMSGGSTSHLTSAPPWKTILNPGEEDEIRCFGYKTNRLKLFLSHLFSILLLGFPWLLLRWRPNWRPFWQMSACPLHQCQWVLLKDDQGRIDMQKVRRQKVDPQHFPTQFAINEDPSTSISSIDETSDTASLLPRVSTSSSSANFSHVFFHYMHAKYVLEADSMSFVRLHGWDRNKTNEQIITQGGFGEEKQDAMQTLYGLNCIDVEVKPYLKLLLEEVLHPFYIFQIGSMILWSFDNYFFYASCIFIISVISIVVSLIQTRRQSQALHDMVAASNDIKVRVCRGRRSEEESFTTSSYELPSPSLVPGDILTIPATGAFLLPCDAVLLSGNCIVNEAMLTGESVPVSKSPLSMGEVDADEMYNPVMHRRHTLFAGTMVIQTKEFGHSSVKAVVVRTGFSTAKGELIRSILFPKPMGFKFYKDSMRFIFVLFCIALLGMAYCMYVYIKRGSDVVMIILRCLDIITIVVPPALPAAMTVGTVYAQSRLKKREIFCISPQRINVSGRVKLVCFDKTGTLTEDGLDLWGVVASRQATFDPTHAHDLQSLPKDSPLISCLATCHSLIWINGEITGDPLDVKMFEATGWTLEEDKDMYMTSIVKSPSNGSDLEQPFEIGVIREFAFSSSMARMSVITDALGRSNFEIYTKGAPEKLEDLCHPDSLPVDFHERLRAFTLQGFRVIALAYRKLPEEIKISDVQRMKREEIERDLTFLGFLVMRNTLKPETTPVIQELKSANIRCVMVTGDNLLTAISVARDCRIVRGSDQVVHIEAKMKDNRCEVIFTETERPELEDGENVAYNSYNSHDVERTAESQIHYALNGKTWALIRQFHPNLLPLIIVRATIFARMSPDQKTQLIESLQEVDYIVGMCGDGANDCGALKAAHIGVSLSAEAEASVAAPFTSRIPNITCIPTLIREGRCALVTSFGVFKYMALYSIIQFVSVLILYSLYTNLGDPQFLYIDLVITTTVAVLMGWTEAYPRLVRKRPPGALVSLATLVSIVLQIILTIAVQVGAYIYLTFQPWYRPNHPSDPEEEIIICWETTTIFCVSSFQYLILATAFSKGAPFRKAFYTNQPFLWALITLTAFTIFLTIYPTLGTATFFQLQFNLQEIRWEFRIMLLMLAFVNMVLAFLIEFCISDFDWIKRISRCIYKKKKPKNKYNQILKEDNSELWPERNSQVVNYSRD